MKQYTYDIFFQYEDDAGSDAITAARTTVRSSLDSAELRVEELSASGPKSTSISPYPVTVRVRVDDGENDVRARIEDAVYGEEHVVGVGHVR